MVIAARVGLFACAWPDRSSGLADLPLTRPYDQAVPRATQANLWNSDAQRGVDGSNVREQP